MVGRSVGYYKQVTPKKTYPQPEKGKCWCCFEPLIGHQRKWCDGFCQNQYWEDTHTQEFVTWHQLRNKIIHRDGHICRGCNEKLPNEGLEVHHIIPVWKDESKEFDEDNLITLCIKCHNKTKKRNKKKTEQVVDRTAVASFFRGMKQEQLLNEYGGV